MDVSYASYYIINDKKKNKGSQMGHTKKIKKKNKSEIQKHPVFNNFSIPLINRRSCVTCKATTMTTEREKERERVRERKSVQSFFYTWGGLTGGSKSSKRDPWLTIL